MSRDAGQGSQLAVGRGAGLGVAAIVPVAVGTFLINPLSGPGTGAAVPL